MLAIPEYKYDHNYDDINMLTILESKTIRKVKRIQHVGHFRIKHIIQQKLERQHNDHSRIQENTSS